MTIRNDGARLVVVLALAIPALVQAGGGPVETVDSQTERMPVHTIVPGYPEAARREVAAQLVPKLKSLIAAPRRVAAPRPVVVEPRETRPVTAVGVAASTGGPKALAELLRELPADLQAPVLVVQHMPENFTAYLAERLDGQCPATVAEAADEDEFVVLERDAGHPLEHAGGIGAGVLAHLLAADRVADLDRALALGEQRHVGGALGLGGDGDDVDEAHVFAVPAAGRAGGDGAGGGGVAARTRAWAGAGRGTLQRTGRGSKVGGEIRGGDRRGAPCRRRRAAETAQIDVRDHVLLHTCGLGHSGRGFQLDLVPLDVNADASRQNSFANFPTLLSLIVNESLLKRIWPRRYPSKYQSCQDPLRVESCIGACMIVRRSAMEAAGLEQEGVSNSEGASVSGSYGLSVYGNSNGFIGRSEGTRYAQSCVLIAGSGEGMQRDYW